MCIRDSHKALRVSAIISINIDDINWEDKSLSVIEKGNKMCIRDRS